MKRKSIAFALVISVLLAPLHASAGFLDKALRQPFPTKEVLQAIKERPPAAPPHAAPAPPPEEAKVKPDDQTTLLMWIEQFDTATRKSASRYGAALLAVTLGTIVLAIGASVAGFLKRATLAGLLSIVSAGILSVGHVLPLSEMADLYHLLSAQSGALRADAALSPTMTVSKYEALKVGLQKLIEAEGTQAPSWVEAQKRAEEALSETLKAFSAP